jgi:tRNA threonylcarbamoyl adenosine modification protein YeaZ
VSVLLGIDTATTAVSVALVADGTTLGSVHILTARRQTEILHPALELLLDGVGRPIDALDAIAVDIGPGRFTGVRVGIAAAKAMAFALGVRLVGVPSTAVLLAGASPLGEGPRDERPAARVAVVDLGRGEVAVLVDGDDPVNGTVRMTPSALGALLLERGCPDAVLVGDGACEYEPAIAAALGRPPRLAASGAHAPSAEALCRAVGTLEPGSADPATLAPLYLRGADVRLGWPTRSGGAPSVRMEVS